MNKILLVRHGESTANLNGIFAGQLNVPLSDTGNKQAERTAEFIAENYKADMIYSSDLKRAYQTAEHIAKKCRLEIIPSEELREIYAGVWDGMSFDDIWEKYPEEMARWRHDIGNSSCPKGESVRMLSERILGILKKIADENDGKTIIIATHATPIRAMQCIWSGAELDEMKNVRWVSNASVTEAVYENGEFSLVAVGLDRHLSELRTKLPEKV